LYYTSPMLLGYIHSNDTYTLPKLLQLVNYWYQQNHIYNQTDNLHL